MSTRTRYRVAAHRPRRSRLRATARIVTLFGIVGGLLLLGWFAAQRVGADLVAVNRSLSKQLDGVLARNERLGADLARERRRHRLDQLLAARLRSELDDLIAQRAALRRELDFYLRFVGRSGEQDGIQVQDLVVTRLQAHRYRFRLVLVQNPASGEPATGKAALSVADASGTVLSLASTSIEYGFRYFQVVDGIFELPEAAQPALVRVDIHPTAGAETDVVSVSFPWNEDQPGEQHVG